MPVFTADDLNDAARETLRVWSALRDEAEQLDRDGFNWRARVLFNKASHLIQEANLYQSLAARAARGEVINTNTLRIEDAILRSRR
jgi:hypothetical protein